MNEKKNNDSFAMLILIMSLFIIIVGAIQGETDAREESRRIANEQYYSKMEELEREREEANAASKTIPTGIPRQEYYPKHGESWCSIAEAHGWDGYSLAKLNGKDWLKDGVYEGKPIQVPASWDMS